MTLNIIGLLFSSLAEDHVSMQMKSSSLGNMHKAPQTYELDQHGYSSVQWHHNTIHMYEFNGPLRSNLTCCE